MILVKIFCKIILMLKDVIPDIEKLVAKFPDPVFYQVADAKISCQ